MNFIDAVISGFGFTAGIILSLVFMCFAGVFINLLYCEIQARRLARKVEKEIKQFNQEIKRKEKEDERV